MTIIKKSDLLGKRDGAPDEPCTLKRSFKGSRMKLSIKLIQNHEEIIANCPELDINCYGSDKAEAIRRIKKVINFYVDSAKELGLDVESLTEITIEGETDQPLSDTGDNAQPHTIN
jgi:hypothetical protein